MVTTVTVRVVSRQKGEAGLDLGEAWYALASLGQSCHEEGGSHAWLLAYVVTVGSRLSLA